MSNLGISPFFIVFWPGSMRSIILRLHRFKNAQYETHKIILKSGSSQALYKCSFFLTKTGIIWYK